MLAKYDPVRASAKARDWQIRNAERDRERKKKYDKLYPEKAAAKDARRRAAKLKATPAWLTPLDWAAINLIYFGARLLTQQTGERHVVDHIYPLRGKTVCGLHVPGNLQVITKTENLRKHTRLPEFH